MAEQVSIPEPRLYTQAELDAAVAQGKVDAGLRVVGDHILAADYCVTCTSHHSTTEIARLEDRLAEEAGRC